MKKILCLFCLFLAAVFSACGSTETVKTFRPPEVGTNFNPPPMAQLGKAYRLPQPVDMGVQTSAVLVDEFGDPIPCQTNADCEGYVYPDECFWGAVCHNDYCEALIYDSCCESSGQDVVCPGLLACGGDEDCADDNECTADYCNFSVLDGRCNNYDAFIGEWVCGTGACKTSVPKCMAGQPVPEEMCVPLDLSDEVCDDADNDCDGWTDEDFPLVGTSCDGGDSDMCEYGTYTCTADGSGVECVNEEPEGWPGFNEVCGNSVDDDCDGLTDEEGAEGCLDFYLDFDGDTFGAEGMGTLCLCAPEWPWTAGMDGDCDDMNEDVNPNISEACNGYDDDCDNLVDEELGTETCGVGPCEHTADICQNGEIVACDPLEGAVPELCDDLDNDCDGWTDEDFPVGWLCDGDDADECPNGTWTCLADGSDVECVNENPVDIAETCDYDDNDCDGLIDEDFWAWLYWPCDGPDSDMCEYGTYTCTADGSDVECVNENPVDITETCDYDDNDCDLLVDEGFELEVECSVGVGVCEEFGWTICTLDELGVECSAMAGDPETELCGNGLDDDCDGETDEGFPLLGLPCDGDDSDLCENGVYVCTVDGLDVECGPEDPADIVELCNDLDDDCDGLTDEDFWGWLDEACDSDDADDCLNGTYTCMPDGSWVECVNEEPANIPEICDGEDNDCDGAVDEEEVCAPCNNVTELSCGSGTVNGETMGDSSFDVYSCMPTWPETGPEDVFSFSSPWGGVSVTGTVAPDSFFDIFVEIGQCGATCMEKGAGMKAKTVAASAGETYFFLVDSNYGAGDYTLTVSCKETNCGDELDNDEDGAADCDDTDCPDCVFEDCSNQMDDDGDGLVDCNDPQCNFADSCAAICEASGVLACDMPVSGTTSGAGNDISGYNCYGGDQTGEDVVYSFTAGQDGVVQFGLSNPSADLDVNVLGGACASNMCLKHGSMWATVEVAVGMTYYVSVDAVGGNDGTFTLTPDCDWQ